MSELKLKQLRYKSAEKTFEKFKSTANDSQVYKILHKP